MSVSVIPTAQDIEDLSSILTRFYLIAPNQAQVHLFKNNVTPDKAMTLALFEEADFDGYAPANITMSEPSINDQYMVVSRSTLCDFSTGTVTEPQTIYGVYVTDHEGEILLGAQKFDTPQTISPGLPQAVSGIWRLSQPYSGYGWIDVEN